MMPAPSGGVPGPLRTVTLLIVPPLIAGVLWGSAGWTGWVPVVAGLAAFAVAAILAPGWRGWLLFTTAPTPASEAAARRLLPRAGVLVLVVAVGLTWLLMVPV